MNGQNTSLPPWLGLGLRIAAFLVLGTLAFATVQSKVNALDTKVEKMEANEVRHEEQMQVLRETQILLVYTVKRIAEDVKEIKEDVKEHVVE